MDYNYFKMSCLNFIQRRYISQNGETHVKIVRGQLSTESQSNQPNIKMNRKEKKSLVNKQVRQKRKRALQQIALRKIPFIEKRSLRSKDIEACFIVDFEYKDYLLSQISNRKGGHQYCLNRANVDFGSVNHIHQQMHRKIIQKKKKIIESRRIIDID